MVSLCVITSPKIMLVKATSLSFGSRMCIWLRVMLSGVTSVSIMSKYRSSSCCCSGVSGIFLLSSSTFFIMSSSIFSSLRQVFCGILGGLP